MKAGPEGGGPEGLAGHGSRPWITPIVRIGSPWSFCETLGGLQAAGRERLSHHAGRRTNIASDAACAERSNVAASAVASQHSACHEQARRENVQALGQVQKDGHAA